MNDKNIPHTHPTLRVAGAAPSAGGRRFREIFGKHAKAMSFGAALLLITNLLVLLIPRLVNEAISFVDTSPEKESVLTYVGITPTVTGVCIAIMVVALVGGLARVASRIVLFNIGRDVERELRTELFSHLSTLARDFYDDNTVGDLMSRLTNDLSNVRLMAGFALLNVMNAFIAFFGNLPLLFKLDPIVALCALIPFPLVIGSSGLLAKEMFRRTRANQEMLGKLTGAVQENLAGQHVVRAFSQGDAETERFEVVNQKAFSVAMRLAVIRLIMFPLMGLMSALGIAIALYIGGRAIVDGRMALGDIVEFIARLTQLAWPTIAMGFIISIYQRGKAGLVRINGVFEAMPTLVDGPHRAKVTGHIRAQGLSFTYPKAESPALKNVDFEVKAGGVIGFVGKNASGKSSVVRALCRLYDVGDEELYVDGTDIRQWNLADLHRGMAVVPDDGFLFSATLRENLTFARPDASDEDVAEAIRIADLERDVETFPEGLSTMVGERGVTLSGGQKQRVSLARAILASAPVLILDDSLSAVDAETETHIVQALREKTENPPTLVIISHRLSAVKDADEIVVLEEGSVLERGKHDVLLNMDGRYADLWGREQLVRALESDALTPGEVLS